MYLLLAILVLFQLRTPAEATCATGVSLPIPWPKNEWSPCSSGCWDDYLESNPLNVAPPTSSRTYCLDAACNTEEVVTVNCNMILCDDLVAGSMYAPLANATCSVSCGGGTVAVNEWLMKENGLPETDWEVEAGEAVATAESSVCNLHLCNPPESCSFCDLLFIVDGTSSVGALNFYKAKEFVRGMVESIAASTGVGQAATRIAIIQFEGTAQVLLYLDGAADVQDVRDVLDRMKHNGGETNTPDALCLARTLVFHPPGDRPVDGGKYKNKVVVVTDGNANVLKGNLAAEAAWLRGVADVWALGVGAGVNDTELRGIASADAQAIALPDFDDLTALVQAMTGSLCPGPEWCPYDYSDCSSTCGLGQRTGTRVCQCDSDGHVAFATPQPGCVGPSNHTEDCYVGRCEGECALCPFLETNVAYLDDEMECGAFYQCVKLLYGYKMVRQMCPHGLHWRQDIWTCDWDAECDCTDGFLTLYSGALGTGTEQKYRSSAGNLSDFDNLSQSARASLYANWILYTGPDFTGENMTVSAGDFLDLSGAFLDAVSSVRKDPIVVDGGWGDWGSWGDCDVICGNGTRSRKRACDNPPPLNCGLYCESNTSYTEACSMGQCTAGRCSLGGDTYEIGDDPRQFTWWGPGRLPATYTCAAGTVFDLVICRCVHASVTDDECSLVFHQTYNGNYDDLLGSFVGSGWEPIGFAAGQIDEAGVFAGQSRLQVWKFSNWFTPPNDVRFTLGFWFRGAAGGGAALAEGLFAFGCAGRQHFLVSREGNTVSVAVDTDAPANCSLAFDLDDVTEWNHIAVSHDGHTLKAYANCNGTEHEVACSGGIVNCQCPLIIGHMNTDVNTGFLNGMLDDVRVYRDSLLSVEGECCMAEGTNCAFDDCPGFLPPDE